MTINKKANNTEVLKRKALRLIGIEEATRGAPRSARERRRASAGDYASVIKAKTAERRRSREQNCETRRSAEKAKTASE